MKLSALTIFLYCCVYLTVAENEVVLNPDKAWMNSDLGTANAGKCISHQCRSTDDASFWTSTEQQKNPAWGIELRSEIFASKIVVTARNDANETKHFHDVYAFVSNDAEKPDLNDINFDDHCAYFEGPATKRQEIHLNCYKEGRYFYLAIKSDEGILQMCHVALFEVTSEELPLKANLAWVSSLWKDFSADYAVTRKCKTTGQEYTAATEREKNPGWAIDLDKFYYVENILVAARNNKYKSKWFRNVYALLSASKPILDDDINLSNNCFHFKGPATQHQNVNFPCHKIGRYVAIVLKSNSQYLDLCHVTVYGDDVKKIPLDANKAWQSTLYESSFARNAVKWDCRVSPHNNLDWASSTQKETRPTWAIDMKINYHVDTILLTARRGVKADRFQKALAIVTQDKPVLDNSIISLYPRACDYFNGPATPLEDVAFFCNEYGRYAVISLDLWHEYLEICHVEIYERNHVNLIG